MKVVEITYRYGAESTPRLRPADSEMAQKRLEAGNLAFTALLDGLARDRDSAQCVIDIDLQDLGVSEGQKRGPKQRPFAAVLGCSDARVPIELIFNEGPNDLFVVRVAGNGLGSDVLGSLKYAVEHLGGSIKVIAVIGHSGCGAISSAVDLFLESSRYLAVTTSPSLREILDRLLVVIQASAKRMQDVFGPEIAHRGGYREALIETSIVINAALTAHTLQEELTRSGMGEIRAVYGVYLLDTREVWAPRRGTAAWTGLANPPSKPADFVDLGNALLNSDRIASLLGAD
jgi:carbonic anhydrase